MTPLSYAVEFLAISQALLAGGAPTPLASFPLKPGEDYHMYLSARINGSEFTCGLDSGGGDRIYLDRGKASAVGIQPTSESRSANPQTATMSTDARAKVTLELGSLKLSDQTLVMQNRPYAAFACNIGLGVLRQYVVEWDYDAPALRVYDAALYKYSGPGREVPFTLQQGSPFVNATLTFPKGDPIEARLAVDTGGGWPAAYLSKSFIDGNSIMSKVSRAVPNIYGMLSTRLEKLSVGAVELPRPIFTLYQERGFGGGAEPDGLLCPGFLRRFKLIFDYPHQKLILEPGSHFRDEMPFDSSGLLVWRQGEAPYRVLKVLEDSPASESGLRQGDIVLEIDGKSAGQLSNAEISEFLMADGRECQLRIQRGEDVLTVKLKLRKLI